MRRPQRWLATCRKIADLCESTAGGICVHEPHAENDALFVFGYEPRFLEKLRSRYAESPMAIGDLACAAGEVSALSMERFHLFETGFFREMMEPFGLVDIIWFPALRTMGRMASLHLSRSVPAAHYEQRDIRLFELLSPHVCRAMAISDLLDIKVHRGQLLEKTLDALAAGVFLTARDGGVIYMNAAGRAQVEAGDSIRLVNNRLAPCDASARVALSRAILRAGSENSDTGVSEPSVGVPDGAGGGYVASLLPLKKGQGRGIFSSSAASVAVFTQDPFQVPRMPGEAFARLHKLTGGEMRVLLALSQGLGGMEVAGMLGISEPTIRTHLQHIYAKTGTSRQADLLRLLHNSTPPVRMLQASAESAKRTQP